jgi:leader peptidase (prepilin peptidase)/N-methyltransferase
VLAGGLCAVLGVVLGVVLGPFLAGLTLSVPAGDPVLGKRWWRGGGAGGRRVAVLTALAAVALGAVGGAVGTEPELPAYLWLGAVGVTLAVIDWETLRLPDRLTLPSYPVGLVLLAVPADWSALGRGVLGAAAAGAAALLLAFVAPGGGLGFGDVKLLGVLGLFLGWLGWGVLVLGVALGFLAGAVAAVALLASRRAGLRDHLAFGPWLIAGALVAVVAGRPLVAAWLGVDA